MIPKPSRRAASASASASVRPPVLSSLMFTASYLPRSAGRLARSCTLSSAQTGTEWAYAWPGRRRCRRAAAARSIPTPALGAGGEIHDESSSALQPSLASTISARTSAPRYANGGSRAASHARAELDFEQRPFPAASAAFGHHLGRAERNGVGGHDRSGAGQCPAISHAVAAVSSPRNPIVRNVGVARGTGRQCGLRADGRGRAPFADRLARLSIVAVTVSTLSP